MKKLRDRVDWESRFWNSESIFTDIAFVSMLAFRFLLDCVEVIFTEEQRVTAVDTLRDLRSRRASVTKV